MILDREPTQLSDDSRTVMSGSAELCVPLLSPRPVPRITDF